MPSPREMTVPMAANSVADSRVASCVLRNAFSYELTLCPLMNSIDEDDDRPVNYFANM